MNLQTELLRLNDKKARGIYLPWWSYEATKKCLLQYKYIRERSFDKITVQRKITRELLFGTGLHFGMENWTRGVSVVKCNVLVREKILEVNAGQLPLSKLGLIIDEAIHYLGVAISLVSPMKVGEGFSEVTVRQAFKGYVLACRVDHVEVIDAKAKICNIWDYKGSSSANSVKSLQLRFNCCCLSLGGWVVRKASFILPKLALVKPIRWSEKLKESLLSNILKDMGVLEKKELIPSPNLWNCTYCNWGNSCPFSILQIDISDLKEGLVDW